MKTITTLSTSLALGLVLTLTGCGGGSDATSPNTVTINGKAIDPYLSGSKVCLDLNENKTCDVNEPYTTTNDMGDYALNIAQEHHDAYHTLLVTGGTDVATGEVFTGLLTAVKEAHQTAHNITPLTTAVEARYQYCQDHHTQCNETIGQIESDLATYLGLTKEEINADVVALANHNHEKALKVALAIQSVATTQDPKKPYTTYQEAAQNGYTAGHDWKNYVQSTMPTSYTLVNKIMNIDENILEVAENTYQIAHQTATSTRTKAQQIAQYVHGLVHK
jgi:hypothetical protein